MITASSEHGALALATWNGRGAVRLIASDRGDGALLLERLDAWRTLADPAADESARLRATLPDQRIVHPND